MIKAYDGCRNSNHPRHRLSCPTDMLQQISGNLLYRALVVRRVNSHHQCKTSQLYFASVLEDDNSVHYGTLTLIQQYKHSHYQTPCILSTTQLT